MGGAAKRAKLAFISLDERDYKVAGTCRAPHVGRRGHCQWKRRGPGAHAVRDAGPASEMSRVREEGGRVCGAPKVFRRLSKEGVSTSRRRVARTMRERGRAGVSRRCAKSPDGREKGAGGKDGAPDLARRRSDADGPDRAWFADITCVRTCRGRPCLAVVMDIWSRRVVGWSMGDRIDARPADDAPRMAICRRRPQGGCPRHSDHGSQYASLVTGKTMGDNGTGPSTGPVDSPWDDAPTESLMGAMKSGCVHAKTYRDREQAAPGIFEHMECLYNRCRIHSALGYMGPCEFEEAYASQPFAA